MNNEPSKDFYTTADIAEVLHLTQNGAFRVVEQARKRGLATVQWMGPVRVISKADFDRILAQREADQSATSTDGWPLGKPRKKQPEIAE